MLRIPNNPNSRFARKARRIVSRIDADDSLVAPQPGNSSVTVSAAEHGQVNVGSRNDSPAHVETQRRNPRRSTRTKTQPKESALEPHWQQRSSRKSTRTVRENRHQPYRTKSPAPRQTETTEIYLHDQCLLPSCDSEFFSSSSSSSSTTNPVWNHFVEAHGIKAGNVSRHGVVHQCHWPGCEAVLGSSFLRHMVEHVISHRCPMADCGMTYTRAGSLSKHVKEVHWSS